MNDLKIRARAPVYDCLELPLIALGHCPLPTLSKDCYLTSFKAETSSKLGVKLHLYMLYMYLNRKLIRV